MDLTEKEIKELLQAREEMLQSYREMQDVLDWVSSRAPEVTENPYFKERIRETNEMVLESLDQSNALFESLGIDI